MAGGYSYTFGDLLCKNSDSACTTKRGMTSFTPSRYGFPRPFLWDEGFHLMLGCRWNIDICLKSLESWLDTMN